MIIRALLRVNLRGAFFMCVGHGAHLVGESPTTGICRQV